MAISPDVRQMIADAVASYRQTPGGAPPAEVVEAVIMAESGGDPRATGPDGARGMALIRPGSDAWEWYLAKPELRQRYGDDPNILYDPAAAVDIAALELDTRQEAGIAAANAGDTGAWQDWMAAAMGHWGYVDNDGQTAPGPNAAYDLTEMRNYVRNEFGLDRLNSIETARPGSVIIGQNAGIEYRADIDRTYSEGGWADSPIDAAIDKGKEAVTGAVGDPLGAVGELAKSAAELGTRIGVFLVGLLLFGAGAWFVFKSR